MGVPRVRRLPRETGYRNSAILKRTVDQHCSSISGAPAGLLPSFVSYGHRKDKGTIKEVYLRNVKRTLILV